MNRKDGIEAMFSKQKILLSQPSSSLGKREYDSTCSPPKELESSDLKHNSAGKCFKLDHSDEPEIVSLQHYSTNLLVRLIIEKAQTSPSKIGKKLKVTRLLLQINLRGLIHTTGFADEAESKGELILSTRFQKYDPHVADSYFSRQRKSYLIFSQKMTMLVKFIRNNH
jgi:hypothetical protein